MLKHSSGFFSCCSIALYNILVFIKNEGFAPDVDFSETFLKYMGPEQTNGNDVYNELFQNNSVIDSKFTYDGQFKVRSLFPYINEDYTAINKIVSAWFSPNQNVIKEKERLVEKYNLIPDEMLCVCFRGTDKYKDIEETDYEMFCSRVEQIMSFPNINSILLQTDQEQFVSYFKKRFTSFDVVIIEENPRRVDREQVAFQLDAKDRMLAAKVFLATMLIMSECKFIINHTGNVARWINLFRGDAENTVQYMAQQEFLNI